MKRMQFWVEMIPRLSGIDLEGICVISLSLFVERYSWSCHIFQVTKTALCVGMHVRYQFFERPFFLHSMKTNVLFLGNIILVISDLCLKPIWKDRNVCIYTCWTRGNCILRKVTRCARHAMYNKFDAVDFPNLILGNHPSLLYYKPLGRGNDCICTCLTRGSHILMENDKVRYATTSLNAIDSYEWDSEWVIPFDFI